MAAAQSASSINRQGATKRVFAGREVILAAGVDRLATIAATLRCRPGQDLSRLGIGVTHDLPGVGANLQDHLCYDHIYRCRQPTLNQSLVLVGKTLGRG